MTRIKKLMFVLLVFALMLTAFILKKGPRGLESAKSDQTTDLLIEPSSQEENKVEEGSEDVNQQNRDIEPTTAQLIEITVSPGDLRQNERADKSEFSKTYKLLAEVELEDANHEVKIELEEPILNAISLVIVGGEGEIKHRVSGVQVNGSPLAPQKSGLNAVYFENDWQKLNLNGNKFTGVSFFGSALEEAGKLKVYLQYQGDVE